MKEAAEGNHQSRMHRALNLRDVVLLNISCIISLSSLAQVAQFGFASMPLWVLSVLVFLIPSGLAVAELNARMPEEGGFYLWTRKAFGEWHGYVAAWSYWLSNIVWLPTALILVSTSFLYAFGDSWLHLSDNAWYNGLTCIAVLWVLTLLNIVGLDKAKWIQNVGGTAIWVAIGLLLVLGSVFVFRFGSVHPFSAGKLIPDLSDFSLLPFFAIVTFSFGGLELAPVMAGEIRDPKRTIPRAIFIASAAVALIYMAGTLMLIFTVEEGQVGIIDGVAQAFFEVGSALHIPGIGALGAILVCLASVGLFGAWMTGNARVPFVIGLDHYLPDVVAAVHPRWGSPYVSLIMQAVVLTVLFLASILGSTVQEAFLVLLDMSIILYFIPFLYIFAALAIHVRRGTGGSGLIPVFQRGKAVVTAVSAVGFLVTLFSVVISTVPGRGIENKALFVTKVVGGAFLLIALGLVVYYLRRGKGPKA